jgi:hypothetical protein
MSEIVVSEELGGDVVTREHGKRLRSLVEERMSSGHVIIDFGGLQITSVSFFDEAFGMLARRLGESLMQRIEFKSIDPFDYELVKDIVHSRAEEARKRSARR